MSQATVLSIATSNTIVKGKFVAQFFVVDQDGNLVGAKAHATEEAASAELGSLKYFAQGMDFAKAVSKPDAKPQALASKANVVAAYLLYLEVGAPKVEVEAEATTETAATETASAEEEF